MGRNTLSVKLWVLAILLALPCCVYAQAVLTGVHAGSVSSPTVLTVAASSIGQTTATLNGSANPNGVSTSAHFEWGTTTSFGTSTGAQALGSGSSPVTIGGGSLTGLSCNTNYFFRASATNSAGTNTGTTLSLTTTACTVTPSPPAVTTGNASGISQTGATLAGTANPNSSATSAQFQWGQTVAYGNATAPQSLGSGSTIVAVSGGTLTGLVCNTIYNYRVTATNGGGTSNGSNANFTTSACSVPPIPPTVTTTSATGISQTAGTLNGTVNPNGSPTLAHFEWGTTSALGTSTTDQALGTGVVTVPIAGVSLPNLTCNTTYFYRASAANDGGTGVGLTVSFLTSPCTVTPPTVTTTAATGMGQTTGTMTATVNPNGSTTSGQFQWGQTTVYGNVTAVQPLGAGASPVALGGGGLAGLQCNTTYNYRATATNSGGAINGSNVTFRTTPCTVPVTPPIVTATAATGIGQTSGTLTGTVNPNSSATTGQFQWGLTTAYGNTTAVQSLGAGATAVSLPGGLLTGLTCNTTYNYRVTATNGGGTSNSANATFVTSNCTVAPTVTTTAATGVTTTTATLNGTANPNGAPTSAGFQWGTTTAFGNATVAQSIGSGSSAVAIPAGALSNLICGTTYFFRGTASNSGGTTTGATQSFNTSTCPPPGPLPVVPGAFGYGMDTRAAYGGATSPAILRVTNLNDTGIGSLRAALTTTGPRVVIFEISGTIVLNSDIYVIDPYLTVAGQTAPSPGITLRAYGIWIYSHDILLQHFRIRPGDIGAVSTGQGIRAGVYEDGGYNIVLDHLSVSWTNDEGTIVAKTFGGNSGTSDANVSFWRCLVAEGLNFTARESDSEGKGLAVQYQSRKVSAIQNMYVSTANRLPLVKGGTSTYFVNNLVYNWWFNPPATFVDPVEDGIQNGPFLVSLIGNHYRTGPSWDPSGAYMSGSRYAQTGSQLYLSDNLRDAVGGTLNEFIVVGPDGIDPRVGSAPVTLPNYTPLPSGSVQAVVLANAGARPTDRDSVDQRLVTDVTRRTGSAMLNSQAEVGGWPTLAVNVRALTTPANPNAISATGYTNLEDWLHGYAAGVEGP